LSFETTKFKAKNLLFRGLNKKIFSNYSVENLQLFVGKLQHVVFPTFFVRDSYAKSVSLAVVDGVRLSVRLFVTR